MLLRGIWQDVMVQRTHVLFSNIHTSMSKLKRSTLSVLTKCDNFQMSVLASVSDHDCRRGSSPAINIPLWAVNSLRLAAIKSYKSYSSFATRVATLDLGKKGTLDQMFGAEGSAIITSSDWPMNIQFGQRRRKQSHVNKCIRSGVTRVDVQQQIISVQQSCQHTRLEHRERHHMRLDHKLSTLLLFQHLYFCISCLFWCCECVCVCVYLIISMWLIRLVCVCLYETRNVWVI